MKKIAIFASGSGSNAQKIMERFQNNDSIEVSLVLTNNSKAKVLDRAKNFGVETMVFNRQQFRDDNTVLEALQQRNIDLVVLAGFLWLVPQKYVTIFPNQIINIHPALLPNYGGKGMYGMNVHEAVKANGEKETGITIHFVNEKYDDGAHIFQAKCSVAENDTPDDIANNIHQLEHEHFPKVIEDLLMDN